ncbi:MAG: hypothetical protein LBC33_01300 [Mycoplasmataceae bacterium]|nr:hypothetical protein [Mycoplasmataceae bacterium]
MAIIYIGIFNKVLCLPIIIKTCKWYESIKNLPEPAFEHELDKKVRSTSWFWYYYTATYKEWKKENEPVMKKYMSEINEYCDTHKMKPEVETEYTIRRLNQLLKAKTITKEQYDIMGDELFLGAWDQFEKEKKLYR